MKALLTLLQNKMKKYRIAMKTSEYHKRMFENIYDLIKGGQFEVEAKKELRKFIKGKELEWDGDNHTVSLGKRFIIKLV